MKQEVKVEGMSCEGCANTIKQRFLVYQMLRMLADQVENKLATIESSSKFR